VLAAGALTLLFLGVAAGSARAATYGAAGFSSSAEGWKVTSSTCSIPLALACASSGEYATTAGNPPGSLATKGTVLVNVVGLFKADTTLESPSFTVGEGGQGTLEMQRAFDPGGLVELNPQLSYTAILVDQTSGQQQKAIAETFSGSSDFADRSGPVSLVAGHSYAIVVESQISATLVGVGLIGSSIANFDNVSVTGPGGAGGGGGNGGGGTGGNGGEGSPGANGLTDARLASILKSSGGAVSAARAQSGRLLVKAKCPKKVGVACRVTLQGLLSKKKPATAPRTVKIQKGKSKLVALKLKPKAKGAVTKRKKLLFKETVKAGSATATLYRPLKLIRR